MSWSQFLIQFLTALFVALGVLYWAFAKRIPNMFQDMLKQNRNFEFDKQLQTDNYYRSNGQSDMQKLIIDWARMLIDIKGSENLDSDGMVDLQSRTIGYASERTIGIVGDLMQLVFQQTDEDPMDNYTFIAYIATISSLLKLDFTEQTFKPMDLIRMKINNLTDKDIKKYQDIIDKILVN
jgi:hypothetical protein